MTGPVWLAAVFAAVMLLIAAGSLARLAMWRLRGRAAEPEADAAHMLMGVAMAGMFEPKISPVPGTAWLAVFAVGVTWFAGRAVRTRRQKLGEDRMQASGGWQCTHPAPHSVECAAMVYMLMAARGAGHGSALAMPSMVSAGVSANPAVALILMLFMLGYIVWTADRMTSQSRASAAPGGPPATAWSRIAMSVGMGYMLLTMV